MRGKAPLVFLLSFTLYFICLDSGASLWDCPEYILVAWGLEIGHPPGNPTWQLMANVVAHLGGTPQTAAVLINLTSAVATALAAAMLCSIIYYFLRYAVFKGNRGRDIIGATVCAICGSLTFAWCDSVIFSAVEAEVYALSIMFTALMVWLAVKWAIARREGDGPKASRWAILTWYVAGLSIGVHELNLLALPAMALIYWYVYSDRKRAGQRMRLNFSTPLWGILFFMIGCTTFFIIPIRAAANPPVNQGAPADFDSFSRYYSREQYGSKPLLYGRTPYSFPLLREEVDPDGRFSYNKYYLVEKGGKKDYVYPDELNMWFPRMTSNKPADLESYEAWAGMTTDAMTPVMAPQAIDSTGRRVGKVNPVTGQREMREAFRPTYLQQLRYMLGYQMGYMYFRYLLWNFAGRQNNVPSTGEIDHGNFITGFDFIDDLMLGAQTSMPADLKDDNRGYNRYFMIPFLLGIFGAFALISCGRKGRRVCSIIALLFLFTGVCIVIYLNQDPGEPRERDYSFLGSFMAFSMWIACGMAILLRWTMKWMQGRKRKVWLPALALVVCTGTPALMLSQTYDDHYRSGRDVAAAVASNILNSLDENAVIFVDGDNIIFPLWYAQEVLGIRRDVTVVETGYLGTEWYPGQLRVGRGGEALPLAMSEELPEGFGSAIDRRIKDIVAKNRQLPEPRPIYWHASLKRPALEDLKEEADLTLFTYKLRSEPWDVENAQKAMEEGFGAVDKLISGGTEHRGFYAEPYVADALSSQRRAMLYLSQRFSEAGDTLRGKAVRAKAVGLWPYGKVPVSRGERSVGAAAQKRAEEYRRYYEALPENRRGALSRESMVVFTVVGGH